MVFFVMPLIARTARIACADRQTDKHETTTVTLAAHARRGLIIMKYIVFILKEAFDGEDCSI